MNVIELHPDDPGPTPPPWEEQEWCDGGTCEHEWCEDVDPDEDYWAYQPGQRVDVYSVPGCYVVFPLAEVAKEFEVELSDEPIVDSYACSCGSRMPCFSPMVKCFHAMRAQR